MDSAAEVDSGGLVAPAVAARRRHCRRDGGATVESIRSASELDATQISVRWSGWRLRYQHGGDPE